MRNSNIYADNAATTQLDRTAFNAMTPWLLEEYGNASQSYAFARNARKALATARQIIADCIHALPEEIYFTSGGTESDNWAIKSTAISTTNKKAIITSAFEHHAVLHTCATLERQGYPLTYLMPTSEGIITSEILKQNITNHVSLVSIMFANNEIGSIQPIQGLSEIAHKHGALFHTDAVQAVGHMAIDVHKLGIDMLSSSAHKFNGPKGIGFLFIRKGVEIPPYMDGGAQEKGYRAGTENIASIVGMATALERNISTLEENRQHLLLLEKSLLQQLDAAYIVYIRNGGSYVLPGLLSLSFPNQDGEAILHRLDLMGISVSTGSACDSANTKISHVLQAIKLEDTLAKGTIRISLGKHNTEDDVKAISDALIKILK